ncbi:MAG: GNAT family N-acetyltransferase [Oscillatoria sp. PMC 1051.18]|nr:GNAT family N-acetyltransferase [Oscillatoria sp. PMC 1050.18]MEC5029007.1 GNAT family N-acetyltransferase [Oscillatoria sp. PMC 1051.18]
MDCSNILFCADKTKTDYKQLQALFKLSAFWAVERTREEWEIAIANSDPVINVWDGERLIGFARATSDCIFRATIWDVVVHPEYRGVGLGRKLVETVLSHPRLNRVERVYLMTTHKQSFYKRIGFEENSSTTMVLSNNVNQPIPVLQQQHQQEEANTVAV